MTQFILTVEGDHAKLTRNGEVVYESSIGTKPPIVIPPPQPDPLPEPPADDPCAGLDEPNFLRALTEGREMGYWDLMKRGFKGPTEQEKACMASRGIPKPSHSPTPSVDKTGSVLHTKGFALRNKMISGQTYRFTIPGTQKGERVQIKIAENGETNEGDSVSEVRGPTGELLSGPSTFNSHYGSHTVTSPGGTLSFYLTPRVLPPEVNTSLSVSRN